MSEIASDETRTNLSISRQESELLLDITTQPKNTKTINNKSFPCKLCHKNFTTKGNLKNHTNTIHNKIFPFKCPFVLYFLLHKLH